MYDDVKLETSLNILSFGIRGEYKVFKDWYFPYISIEMLANYFDTFKNGSKYKTNELYPTLLWDAVQFYSKETRIGAGTGLGYNFNISSKFSVDVFVNYLIFNIVGKKEKKGFLGSKIMEKKVDSIHLTIGIFYKL